MNSFVYNKNYSSWYAGTTSDKIKTISINDVEPSEEAVKNGSYIVQRPFLLVTKKDKKLSNMAQKFFDYSISGDVIEIIQKAGVITSPVEVNSWRYLQTSSVFVIDSNPSLVPLPASLPIKTISPSFPPRSFQFVISPRGKMWYWTFFQKFKRWRKRTRIDRNSTCLRWYCSYCKHRKSE